MIELLNMIWNKVKSLFKKPMLASSEQTHWVNHIHDETVTWPNSAMMWMNVHGFDEGPGQTYWVGLDGRSFGIRIADYVVKCKTKALYDEYIHAATHDPTKVLYKMREDSRLNYKYGDYVNVDFMFRWGDEDKHFDVHLGTDSYAEEK